MNPLVIDSIILAAVCGWAGYVIGKARGWDETYKLGHTHGYQIGLLDGALKEINAAIKKQEARSK